MNKLSDIIIHTKYARFLEKFKRREVWDEIVERNEMMHMEKYPDKVGILSDAYNLVYKKQVLPSMRSLQFGGFPIFRNESRIYNCAYLPIEHPDAFSEIMFLLLGGTGVGYSVQYRHVNKLPYVKPQDDERKFLIMDSIEGWSDAIKVLVESYFYGRERPRFDFSDIRKEGELLKVTGGKAPGPAPLKYALENIDRIFSKAIGRNLKPLEAHDICCFIADAVLVAGIRRAALISLFSPEDADMLASKTNVKIYLSDGFQRVGDDYVFDQVDTTCQTKAFSKTYHGVYVLKKDYDRFIETGELPWYCFEPQRARSNNSVVLLRGEDEHYFADIWEVVKNSGSGEPGIYWTNDRDWGTNPCVEVALRPYTFCNLVEINGQGIASEKDFYERCKAAATIATFQASYTDFHYLRSVWKHNTRSDALIGVGITGIADNCISADWIGLGASIVKETNADVASQLGINPAARTTVIKPAGTSSLVLGSSSGIHGWHAPFFIRRVRFGRNEAIAQYLLRKCPELIEECELNPKATLIFSMPQKAPEGATNRFESTFDLLDRVLLYNKEWIRAGYNSGVNHNNVSATLSVKEDEWDKLGEILFRERNNYNGISVLPYDGGTYVQAPLEEISENKYNEMCKHLHKINLLEVVEDVDSTSLSGEAACAGGQCEVM